MTTEMLFAGVRVRELAAAVDWYRRLFGRDPDIVPNDDEVMWRVADGGWVYVIEEPAAAGKSLVTIAVKDLGASVAEITDRGISLGAIEAVGDAARKAKVADPDGNSVALIEVTR